MEICQQIRYPGHRRLFQYASPQHVSVENSDVCALEKIRSAEIRYFGTGILPGGPIVPPDPPKLSLRDLPGEGYLHLYGKSL